MAWATALRGGRNHFSRSSERLPEASQHREISVKLDALQAADAERGEAELVFHGDVDLVAVEAAALPSGDGRAMPPRGVRIREALALPASMTDVALTIREGGEVGGI